MKDFFGYCKLSTDLDETKKQDELPAKRIKKTSDIKFAILPVKTSLLIRQELKRDYKERSEI